MNAALDGFTLRPATRADSPRIRQMIYSTGLNPTGLDWRRFTLACAPDAGGTVIGIAQVKPVKDGLREFASLAVDPAWRGRGVAAALIHHHIGVERAQPGDSRLYLVCRGNLGPFYRKFGFVELTPETMPAYFLKYYRIAAFLKKLSGVRHGMLVMSLVL